MAKVEEARLRVLWAATVLSAAKLDGSEATADAVSEWIGALHAYEVALFEYGYDWHHVMSDEVIEEYEAMLRVEQQLAPVFMRVIRGEMSDG
jgi:hypothetical protein